MSVMVGVGRGAQSGVLIKNAEALEKMNTVDILIVDKTGTITEGKPSVEKVIATNAEEETKLVHYITSLNQYSEHPLAEAIVNYGKSKKVSISKVNDFEAITGKGVSGTVGDKKVALGNAKLLEQFSIVITETLAKEVKAEQQQGKTVSYITEENEAVGYVSIFDAIKKTSEKAIKELQNNGVEVIMLTGDNKNTAKAVAEQLNLKHYKAECLPEDKLNEIKTLQQQGKIVAMAGDGINDAPALAQSDVGIAMGTGTDVAMNASDLTIVSGDLRLVADAILLSRATLRTISANVFWAFIYNAAAIPLAALGYMNPMWAGLAMAFSSVFVVSNSLRLRTAKLTPHTAFVHATR